ncbi:MAG TPA: aldo/keto reductase [Vicinamibacterales bacterium]|jgi:aryl-alcohol dehydrogenase-like predicted oxidoreductase
MQQRKLGASGLDISTVGLGSWAIGGWMWGSQDDAESTAAIHAAVDNGVNWIDTAPIYGGGHSELIVGRAVRALPASRRPFIFTKFGVGSDTAVNRRAASRAEVIAECDASLKRLGVDHVDLFQQHWPSEDPIAETARACEELLEAGKIRAIGVSNYSVAQLEAWTATGVPLHSLQSPYSILRPAVKDTVLPWCNGHDVGVVAYSPLFRGLLFGTWSKDKTFPPGDTRGSHKDYAGPRFARHLDAIREITEIAIAGGLSCPQLCIGVLLGTPGVTGCIVGARNARQGALIANLGVTVTEAQANAVSAIIGRLEQDLARL